MIIIIKMGHNKVSGSLKEKMPEKTIVIHL